MGFDDKIKNYVNEKKIEWILVDCFDTLVHRKISHDRLIELWSIELTKRYGLCSLETLINIRKEAERAVNYEKGIIIREFTYCDLMNQCWKRIKSLGDVVEEDFDKFYQYCLDLEVSLEAKNIYTDEYIVALLRGLCDIKICVLSDIYLEADCISELLKSNGIDFIEEIIVSCENGKAKYSGDLYSYALEKLGVHCKKAVMIGDNHKSDCVMAQKNGIKAFEYKHHLYDYRKLVYRNLKSISENDDAQTYSNYAFSLYLFIERLTNRLLKEKYADVYFCSREGQYLKRIFDEYCARHGITELKSHYLYVSRISTYAASLKHLDDEKFEVLFKRYPNISINTFLKSIGIPEADILLIENESHIDFNAVIDDIANSNELVRLRASDIFRSIYEKHRVEQKELFKKIFSDNGTNLSHLAIVDVGWRGTIQDNLYVALVEENANVQGFYIGLSKLNNADSLRNKKTGLLFSEYPIKTPYFDIWSFDRFMFERLLIADHPTTIGYELKDSVVQPIFKGYLNEDEAYKFICPIQESMFEKFKAVDEFFSTAQIDPEQYEKEFVRIHAKELFMLDSNKINTQKRLYDYNHESFGEFSKTKNSFAKELLNAFFYNRIPVKKLVKNKFDISFFSSVSIMTMCITHHLSLLLRCIYYFFYKQVISKYV